MIMNSDDIESHILSRVENEKYAIYNYHDSGPIFGDDLTLISDYGFCVNCYYEKQIRKTNDDFYAKEYEPEIYIQPIPFRPKT
uniref:Uncharacterized protein n=1 Tax=Rhizophagus irregularis (strain DAOM 181602 / DAOM 197198 / MUCL 43194) TaxID=747089 RepID=U9T8F1_RHIID